MSGGPNNNESRADSAFGAGTRTDISFLARLAAGVSNVVRGASDAWFGPMQPLQPIPPTDKEAGVVGRRFDYPTGYNLNQRPRGYEPVDFSDLRGLARGSDMVRLAIETRKDQITALDWVIRVKSQPGQHKALVKTSQEQRDRIHAITDFLQYPDRELSFDQWMRAFMEDLLVIDAPVVYVRPDRAGRVYSLELIDGATIAPKLDATGRRPAPPDVAYQQILKGIPAADYSADELYYCMRNPSTDRVYGYSPTEQVLITANIAVRRSLWQLDYYTKGSQPDAFLGLPKEWNMDQIKSFQNWLDSLKAQRRVLRAVPGEFKYQATKDPVLKDEYDDYLSRVIFFAFGVDPTSVIKTNNRSIGESQHDAAIEDGLAPIMKFVRGTITRIINEKFNSPDLEFDYVDDEAADPKVQAEIDKTYVSMGAIPLDKVRERLGEEPLGGAFGQPMVLTATGYIPVEPPAAPTAAPAGAPGEADIGKPAVAGVPALQSKPLPSAADAPGGRPSLRVVKTTPGSTGKKGEAVKKAAPGRYALGKAKQKYRELAPAVAPRKDSAAAVDSLTEKLMSAFEEIKRQVVEAVTKKLGVKKADAFDFDKSQIDDILKEIDLSSLMTVATSTGAEAEEIARKAGASALARLGVSDNSDLVNQVSDEAVSYAKERAAELVGKRINADGSIIDNPDAKYRIDEATRDSLRDTISSALERASTAKELIANIEDGFAFSKERASMIAYTEIGDANSQGSLRGYKAAEGLGLRVQKKWMTSGYSNCCEACEENEAAGAIDLDDTFPSGDDAPLAHPNCNCVLISVVADGDNGDDE